MAENAEAQQIVLSNDGITRIANGCWIDLTPSRQDIGSAH
jgi:hypothetical protein